jgi:hypothetical protein
MGVHHKCLDISSDVYQYLIKKGILMKGNKKTGHRFFQPAVKVAIIVILLFSFHSLTYAETTKTEFHRTTEWDIVPSQAFDVLCLLNTLTADSFYLDYYDSEYQKFAPRITPEVKAALDDLKLKVKDQAGEIISASLCLYFSATDDSTLDDLLATLGESSGMQANLKLTAYYSDDGWRLYESVKGDLDLIFHFLKSIGIENYWRENILPKERTKIDSIKVRLSEYNIIPLIEEMLGKPLSSNRITVYMLYYSQPHGIRITGTRFLTDMAWPFEIVVRNAVHEMMHPPYVADDSNLTEALNVLKKDDFLMNKVLHHDSSFGYNTSEGFIEEDCVQALDQTINEKLHVAKEAHQRWLESDDGMHVFAVALYQVIKSEKFNQNEETFQNFLIRNIRSGKLAPGTIKLLYDAFYKEIAAPK